MAANYFHGQSHVLEGLTAGDQSSQLAALIAVREAGEATEENRALICKLLEVSHIAVKSEAISVLGVVGTSQELPPLRLIAATNDIPFCILAIEALMKLQDFEFAAAQIEAKLAADDLVLKSSAVRLKKLVKKLTQRSSLAISANDKHQLPTVTWTRRTADAWNGKLPVNATSSVPLMVYAPLSKDDLDPQHIRSARALLELSTQGQLSTQGLWESVKAKLTASPFRSPIFAAPVELLNYELEEVILPAPDDRLQIAVAFRLRAAEEQDMDAELFWLDGSFVALENNLIADDPHWFEVLEE